MRLQQNIHALIRYGEQSGYVVECTEIAVVTQGQTLDQVLIIYKKQFLYI